MRQRVDAAPRSCFARDAMRQEWDDDTYTLYEIFAAGGGADHPFLDDVGRDGIGAGDWRRGTEAENADATDLRLRHAGRHARLDGHEADDC